MKDYKAECDKLRGELVAVKRELEQMRDREQRRYEREESRKEEMRRVFKDFMMDILGR